MGNLMSKAKSNQSEEIEHPEPEQEQRILVSNTSASSEELLPLRGNRHPVPYEQHIVKYAVRRGNFAIVLRFQPIQYVLAIAGFDLAKLLKKWNERERPKINRRILLSGHFQSGKSTAIGNIINKLGGVENGEVERNAQQLAAMGKPTSGKYAWVLDRLSAERQHGMTLACSSFDVETAKCRFKFINAPGSRDLIENMISGTKQADCAVLFIDSTTGGFEAGISRDGQLRVHSLLAFTLGIRHIICCCNKMDATIPRYSLARYEEIVKEVSTYLKLLGFNPKKIPFVPISGFEGDNLIERSESLYWYQGPTLLEALERIPEMKRPSFKSLRLPLRNAYDIGNRTMVEGCVETGVLKRGSHVAFGRGVTSRVVTIERQHESIIQAHPGEVVWMEIYDGIGARDFDRGCVASNGVFDTAKEAVSFTAQLFILNPGEIRKAYTAFMDCHTSHSEVFVDKILTKIDRVTGQELEREPEVLKEGESGLVRMMPFGPVVVETFSQYPPLGYFTLTEGRGKKTLALGIIKTVERSSSP